MTPVEADDPSAGLADGLRDAFAAIAAASMPVDEKGRWQRRLLAITTASKRDVVRAREQLDRFRGEWDARNGESNSAIDVSDR